MWALAFRGPEPKAERATCSTGSIRSNSLHVASGAVLERCAEVVALRRRIPSGHDIQAAGESVRSKWWHRGRIVCFAVDVLLPVALRAGCVGLLIRNHCIGIVEHGRGVVQPISRGISSDVC